jgi:Zn-dependent alcohol dehydrogenase
MRAAVMQGLHKPLAIETLPDPTPGEGEVVVKVGRCGICGSDLHMTEDPVYGKGVGDVLGHEFAGEVVALGNGAEGLALGDLVSVIPLQSCGHCASCKSGEVAWCDKFGLQGGGYAEYAITRLHRPASPTGRLLNHWRWHCTVRTCRASNLATKSSSSARDQSGWQSRFGRDGLEHLRSSSKILAISSKTVL